MVVALNYDLWLRCAEHHLFSMCLLSENMSLKLGWTRFYGVGGL
jgi:hypothetical protein